MSINESKGSHDSGLENKIKKHFNNILDKNPEYIENVKWIVDDANYSSDAAGLTCVILIKNDVIKEPGYNKFKEALYKEMLKMSKQFNGLYFKAKDYYANLNDLTLGFATFKVKDKKKAWRYIKTIHLNDVKKNGFKGLDASAGSWGSGELSGAAEYGYQDATFFGSPKAKIKSAFGFDKSYTAIEVDLDGLEVWSDNQRFKNDLKSFIVYGDIPASRILKIEEPK